MKPFAVEDTVHRIGGGGNCGKRLGITNKCSPLYIHPTAFETILQIQQLIHKQLLSELRMEFAKE